MTTATSPHLWIYGQRDRVAHNPTGATATAVNSCATNTGQIHVLVTVRSDRDHGTRRLGHAKDRGLKIGDADDTERLSIFLIVGPDERCRAKRRILGSPVPAVGLKSGVSDDQS